MKHNDIYHYIMDEDTDYSIQELLDKTHLELAVLKQELETLTKKGAVVKEDEIYRMSPKKRDFPMMCNKCAHTVEVWEEAPEKCPECGLEWGF